MATAAAAWVDVLPSFKNFGSTLTQGLGEQLGGAGKKAGDQLGEETRSGFSAHAGKIAAVGAIVGTGLVMALKNSMDTSAANAKMAAQLGLTGPEAARYGKLAGDLYSQSYGESLSQVNDALVAVRQNIGGMANASDADLQNVSKGVLNLSSAFGLDLAESTRAVGTMLRTGMAPNAQAAMDILTSGLQNGTNAAGDLLDTFNEYSTQFRKLGLDGAAATGLLSQGLKGGARDADLVADALKEFSIRAVDGSKSSAAGFAALGLNAEKMNSQIAQGGPAATAGLDTVLDRLRAMKDPVAQSQTAVALFGTQAEDLGAALYSLDPSGAVAALGQVGGAAAGVDQALGQTATARIEGFRRSLETNVTGFVGNQLIPGLQVAAGFIGSVFGPVWSTLSPILAPVGPQLVAVGAGLAGVVVAGKGISAVGSAISDTKDMAVGAKNAVTGLFGAEGSIRKLGGAWDTVKSGANTAVSATQTAGTWIADTGRKSLDAARNVGSLALQYGRAGVAATLSAARTVGAAIATGVVTAATWAWSAAQAALNFVMNLNPITLIIIGIVALIGAVIYAYNNFEWFRNGVQAAWAGIQSAASAAWTGFLQPVFSAIGSGVSAVGGFFVWLWQSAIVPAWGGIQAAAAFGWSVLGMVFGWIQGGIRFVGSVFTWWWQNIVVPAWGGIQAAAQFGWSVLSMVFGWIQGGIRLVGSIFTWLWQNVVVPAWVGIQGAIAGGWRIVEGVFGFFRSGIDAVGRAVQSVADWIGRSWDGIRESARRPVQWVVDVVYNNGIRRVWNGIASLFGMDPLNEVRFERGGVVPVSPMMTNGPMAIVGEGKRRYPEYVIPTDPAYRDRAQALWSQAGGSLQMLESGGILGDIGTFTGDLFTKGPAEATRALFASVVGDAGGTPGTGGWREALVKMPGKVIDAVIGKAKGWVDSATTFDLGAGGGVVRWSPVVLTALAMMGQNPLLLPTVLRRMNQESGGNPTIVNGWDINAKRGTPSVGLMQVIGPTYRANADPRRDVGPYIAGTSVDPLSNILASMRYAIRTYGSLPAAYNKAGGYDSGGWLQPGWTSTYNGTGKPEAVFTDAQWRVLAQNVQGGDGGGRETHLHVHGDIVDPIDLDVLMAKLDFEDRKATL